MTAILTFQTKRKRDELNNHINRLEHLISKDQAALTTKETISQIITAASGREPSDNEIQDHEEDINAFNKFEHLMRAQMLVSICGYFEYVVKKALKWDTDISLIGKGLGAVIKRLRDSGIVDTKTCNALDRYREIRNVCVHSNSISKTKNQTLAFAHKDEALGGTIGMKLKHSLSREHDGKGLINVADKNFLPDAMTLHFNTITTVLAYAAKKNKRT